MYTGIVYRCLEPSLVEKAPGLITLGFEFDDTLLDGLELGASVSVNGVCLTVSSLSDSLVKFDVMQETLERTTLGGIHQDCKCNIERSAIMGAEVGGHVLSGHIDGLAQVERVESTENNHVIHFSVPEKLALYLFEKGFVGLNGCSLTISGLDFKQQRFWVALIPETLRRTNLGELIVGDKVNLEIDRTTQVIVDTIHRCFDRIQQS